MSLIHVLEAILDKLDEISAKLDRKPEKNQGASLKGLDEKRTVIIPLTKWNDYYTYPSYGTMRNLVSRRKENGAELFLVEVNGRFSINVERFFKWLDGQKEISRESVKPAHSP